MIQKVSKISIKNKPMSKAFDIGEEIIITDEEFMGITWSHFQFGNNLISQLKEADKEDGWTK